MKTTLHRRALYIAPNTPFSYIYFFLLTDLILLLLCAKSVCSAPYVPLYLKPGSQPHLHFSVAVRRQRPLYSDVPSYLNEALGKQARIFGEAAVIRTLWRRAVPTRPENMLAQQTRDVSHYNTRCKIHEAWHSASGLQFLFPVHRARVLLHTIVVCAVNASTEQGTQINEWECFCVSCSVLGLQANSTIRRNF